MTNGTGITILPLQLSVGNFEDSPPPGGPPCWGQDFNLSGYCAFLPGSRPARMTPEGTIYLQRFEMVLEPPGEPPKLEWVNVTSTTLESNSINPDENPAAPDAGDVNAGSPLPRPPPGSTVQKIDNVPLEETSFFAFSLLESKPGTYQYRAYIPAAGNIPDSYSPVASVTVTKWNTCIEWTFASGSNTGPTTSNPYSVQGQLWFADAQGNQVDAANTAPSYMPQPDANGNYPQLNGQTIQLTFDIGPGPFPGAVAPAPRPTMTGENGTFTLTLYPGQITDGGYECYATYNGDRFFNSCNSRGISFGDTTGLK